MRNPVDLFIEMVKEVPHQRSREVASLSCMSLGHRSQPTGVEPSREKTMGELFNRPTMADLRERMTFLIQEVRLEPRFLIDGLFTMLENYYGPRSDPQAVSEFINQDLDLRQWLQDELRKGPEERQSSMNDEELRDFRAKVEKWMTSKSEEQPHAKEVLAWLHAEQVNRFGGEYWKDWYLEKARMLEFPGFGESS